MITALVPQQGGGLATVDILADFDKILRLHTADGDASPATIRSYHSNAGQFAAWCAEHGINPATATEDDIAAYRKALVAQYATGTVAVKLAAIRRLYRLPCGGGCVRTTRLPGCEHPRTGRSGPSGKFLPLDGLRRLLDAPTGDDPAAHRDRAILALMGRRGLWLSEAAGLTVDDVDLRGDRQSSWQRPQGAQGLTYRDIGGGAAPMAGHQGGRGQSDGICLVRLSEQSPQGRGNECQSYPVSGG
jgi:site-specific recombinase XerC